MNIVDKKTFIIADKCLNSAAKKRGISPVEALNILDSSEKFRGIRNDYLKMYSKVKRKISAGKGAGKGYVEHLPINVTGVRPGETIIGTRTQAKDALIKVVEGIYPPSKEILEGLYSDQATWNSFIRRLKSIPFFASLTSEERQMWLWYYADVGELYMDDVQGLTVELLDPGSGDFIHLDEKYLNRLAEGEHIGVSELSSWFPNKPGSDGLKGKSTLIFRPSLWSITTRFTESSLVDEDTLVIVYQKVQRGYSASDDEKIYIVDVPNSYNQTKKGWVPEGKKKIGIVSTPGVKIKLEDFVNYSEYLDEDSVQTLYNHMKDFTSSILKSMLQKIIRFRPKRLMVGSEEFDSSTVISFVFLYLLIQPPTFVPTIGRFVNATESAFKRLVVTIMEDSSTDDWNAMIDFIVTAYLAQRIPGFLPTEKNIQRAVRCCVESLDAGAYVYDIRKGMGMKPYELNEGNSKEIVSVLLDELKSFQTDLGMVRHIVSLDEDIEIVNKNRGLEITDYVHGIDHHCCPEIAYFYKYSLVKGEYESKTTKPFSNLFKGLWDNSSKLNPRRQNIIKFTDSEFFASTRRAQDLTLRVRMEKCVVVPPTNKETNFDIELDRSVIAGLLGAVNINVKGARTLVTINPTDIHEFVAIRKPSRNMKEAFLDAKTEHRAISTLKSLLEGDGLPLKAASAPLSSMKGARLVYRDKVYYIKLKSNKKLVPWEEFRRQTISIPYTEYNPDEKFEDTLFIHRTGIVRGADELLNELLYRTPTNVLQRALMYTSSYGSKIELTSIGREGGGTGAVGKMNAVIDDVGVYSFLIELSRLYPSAVQRVEKKPLTFKVGIPQLLRKIHTTVELFTKESASKSFVKWKGVGEKMGREPWKHQISAVEEMQHQHVSGRKGNFLWATVGLGKTMIVMMYLEWLNMNKKLPKYIIYTLPSVAMESVKREILSFGFNVKIIVPLKKLTDRHKPNIKYITQDCIPEEYHINLIEHDHLKNCSEGLAEYMSNSIFIIDEVHKALNQTLRTEAALKFSYLSQEFIALTGTPIIDNTTYKLVWWLKQISPFEVNDDNFWVAVNNMVAKKIVTGVRVESEDVLCKFTSDEEDKYMSLVTPAMGGNNQNPRHSELQEAIDLCYRAATRGMIKETMEFIQKGMGVFIVAKDSTHQKLLEAKLRKKGVDSILLLEKGKSVFLTDESVEKGEEDYKVVITTIRQAEGYTVTRLKAMVTSVYPSNNATREQLEGRINRICQRAKVVHHRTVHCGILTYILKNHNDAKNLSTILSSIAQDVVL